MSETPTPEVTTAASALTRFALDRALDRGALGQFAYGFRLPLDCAFWSTRHGKIWLYVAPYMVLSVSSVVALLFVLVALAGTFSLVGSVLTALTGGTALCCGQSMLMLLTYSTYLVWVGINSLYALLLGKIYEIAEQQTASELDLVYARYRRSRVLPRQIAVGIVVWSCFFLLFSMVSMFITLVPIVGVFGLAVVMMLQYTWDYGFRLTPGSRMWSVPETMRWFKQNIWMMVGMTTFLTLTTLFTAGLGLPLVVPFLAIGAARVVRMREARGDALARDRRLDHPLVPAVP